MAELRIDTREIAALGPHFRHVAEEHPNAVARALNHTGGVARTRVIRALVQQTGARRPAVVNSMQSVRANEGTLQFLIIASGAHLSLKEFGARQTRRGVSAAPWRQRRVFPGAFVAASIGGHVFSRKGTARLPIGKLWGPAVPREMVRGESAAAFTSVVDGHLPGRLEHEIARLLASRPRRRR